MDSKDPQEPTVAWACSHTAQAFDVCALPETRCEGADITGNTGEPSTKRCARNVRAAREPTSRPPTDKQCYAGGSPAEISCRAALVSFEKWIRRSCQPAAAGIGSGSPCGVWANACSEICTVMLWYRACSAAPPRREFAISGPGSLDKPPTAHSTITFLRVNSIQPARMPKFSL